MLITKKTKEKKKPVTEIYMLISLIMVTISQCICISNHVVYIKYMKLYVDYSAINMVGEERNQKEEMFLVLTGTIVIISSWFVSACLCNTSQQ